MVAVGNTVSAPPSAVAVFQSHSCFAMAARSLGFSARSTRRCSGRACFGPCFVSTLLWLVLVLAPGPDEDRQRSPPAPRRRIGEAAFHVVHVCVATDQLLPVGLLAVVNSTLHHWK